MNKLCFVLLSSVGLLFFGCGKSEIPNEEVASFLESLEHGNFEDFQLPDFDLSDIESFLQYRNDKTIISGFPVNPYSSYFQEECTLGVYALWMIEGIRLKEVNHDLVYFGFPSLNPILILRNSSQIIEADQIKAQVIVSDAYKSWWQNQKGKQFHEFIIIDPIADTDYKWR